MNGRALRDVVGERDGLVAQWVDEQVKAVSARPDLIKESELREQSLRFVGLFEKALAGESLDIHSEEWAAVREFVTEISASRTRQGFTPAETATFLFSIKRPLFTRLGEKLGNDTKNLLREVWNATVVLDKLGLLATEVHQATRDEVIRRQQAELIELSTPVMKIWDRIVVLPLIGTLDSTRTQLVMETLLERIVETGSEMAIIDITGVVTVDTLTAQHLLKTVTATRLMGADCIISGVRPQIAQTLVQLGVNMSDIQTKATLAAALAVALQRTGATIGSAR